MSNSNNERKTFDYTLKIILIGNSGVGKTQLINRYTLNEFMESFNSTIGVEFMPKELTIKDKLVKIQIWDMAGQEKFASITKLYYKGANGAVLVYSIENKDSFKNIQLFWHNSLRQHTSPDIPVMLIGNKCDLEENRMVSVEEGKEYASENSNI